MLHKPNKAPSLLYVLICSDLLALIFVCGFVLKDYYTLSSLPAVDVILLSVFVALQVLLFLIGCIRQWKFRHDEKIMASYSSDFADYFRYMAPVHYFICDGDGYVKLVSMPMRDALQLNTQICNKPMSDFSDISVDNVISLAKTGQPLVHSSVSEDGIPLETKEKTYTVIAGRRYNYNASVFNVSGKEYYFVMLTDVNEQYYLSQTLMNREPVVAYVMLDNLQELVQHVKLDYKSVVAEVENKLSVWASQKGGILKELDLERYIMLFNQSELDAAIDSKFDILDIVHGIKTEDGSYAITVSMGIGAVKGSFEDKERAAIDALEIALQKGGDQAVVNREGNITIYGGRVNTTTSTSTVSSRVNAQFLINEMKKADNVIIMGHKYPDYDAIGAMVGLGRLAICARGSKNDIYLVTDFSNESVQNAVDLLGRDSDARDMMVSPEVAASKAGKNSFIILTDCNVLVQSEQPLIFRADSHVAIIDHHRRGNDVYPFSPMMTYIRPGVSAASELVSELLEFSAFQKPLGKKEAALLLAGLMLDTKNFTIGTSTRTFSTLQYLYGCGASSEMVRDLFSESIQDLQDGIVFDTNVRTYRDVIALTWMQIDRRIGENDSIMAAKTADKILKLEGVEASFALVAGGDEVYISARSRGKINVQLMMQRLGGGGHFEMAAAKMQKTDLESACKELKNIIDDTLKCL